MIENFQFTTISSTCVVKEDVKDIKKAFYVFAISNFLLNLFICVHREYPCDHYTSVIAVTLVMCGCPRTDVQATAIQLLQILDKRFFNNVGLLHGEREKGK